MTEPSSSSRRSGFGRLGGGLFALVMVGAMVLLTVTLVGECSAGTDVVNAYVSSIRGGDAVSRAVGGDEAEALTAALRGTRSIGVDNFQAQAGTACYWVRLRQAEGDREARFLLGESGDGWRVIGASLRRECTCPDPDFEQRCRVE